MSLTQAFESILMVTQCFMSSTRERASYCHGRGQGGARVNPPLGLTANRYCRNR